VRGIVYYRLGQFQNVIEVPEEIVKLESGRVTALDLLCLAMSCQRFGETLSKRGD